MPPTLLLTRRHSLGLKGARDLAEAWRELGRREHALCSEREDAAQHSRISFQRPGVRGVLWVREEAFELELELGFLLRPHAERIRQTILRNMDVILGPQA